MRHANPSKSALALALTALLIVFGSSVLVIGLPVLAQEVPITAWEKLLEEDPHAVEDTSISALERRILQVLTPEQADAYAAGQDPEEILVPGGECLATFIDRTERTRAAGLVIRPIEPCTLVDTRVAGTRLAARERRTVRARGPAADYSAQGGSAEGCGIPDLRGDVLRRNAARGLLVAVEVRDADGPGMLKLWPAHGPPEPAIGVLAYGPDEVATASSLIIGLCEEESVDPCPSGDLELKAEGAGADVVLTVMGVLETVESVVAGTPHTGDTAPTPKATVEPYWEKRTDSDVLYYLEGGIGVRTDNPEATLHVQGSGEEGGALITQPYWLGGEDKYFEPLFPTLSLKRRSSTRGATLSIGNTAGQFHIYAVRENFKIFDADENLRLRLKSNGNFGLGTDDPLCTLHVDGGFLLRDPSDQGLLIRTLQRQTTGYAGGGPHDLTALHFSTPYEELDGSVDRLGLVFASPEVWGAESVYRYSFGQKNLRLGIVNDNWRRAEIEIYNNNTSKGKIFFRTGEWRDPGNTPGVDTNVRMVIDHQGRVGIGEISPSEPLDVAGNVRLSGRILADGGLSTNPPTGRLNLMNLGRSDDVRILVMGEGDLDEFFLEGDFANGGSTGNTLQLNTYWGANAMSWRGDGNVGVGVVNPGAKLEVGGDIKLSGNILSDGDICIGNCN